MTYDYDGASPKFTSLKQNVLLSELSAPFYFVVKGIVAFVNNHQLLSEPGFPEGHKWGSRDPGIKYHSVAKGPNSDQVTKGRLQMLKV